MKRHGILIVLLVTFIAFMLLLTNTPAPTQSIRGSKPIKIALHFSTSGWGRSFAVEELHGGLLAIHQINAAGGIYGRPLEVVITDLRSDYNYAVTVAKKMAADKEIIAALGDGASGIVMAMKPVYFEAHMPTIAPVKAGILTKENFDYTYRCLFNDDWAVPASLKLWKETLGIKTISILHTADAFGQSGGDTMVARAQEYGIKVLSRDNYAVTATDVTPQLIRVKAVSPDALIMWGYGEPIINAFRGIKTIGFNKQILGPSGIFDANIISAVPEQVIGAIIADAMSVDDPIDEVQKKFISAFKAMYPGETFTVYAGAVHDAANILAEALKKVVKGDESIDRDEVKRALDKTDYFGNVGHFKWSATYHEAPEQLMLMTAKKVGSEIKVVRYSK